jgi:hypothetical protein
MIMSMLIGLTLGLFFVALIFGGVNIAMSLGQNGCLFHGGWKRYSPNLLLLVNDMEKHPDDYTVDHFTLESKDVCIWIANGFTFYKDHERFTSSGKDRVRVGTLSVFDRLLLSKALRKFNTSKSLDFELALRRKNGLMGDKR